uniref:Uncharacterized protein n=1 Tax=Romanomermis culicivorax TaxID=13658 RepID=A0A915JCR0_ROMCU
MMKPIFEDITLDEDDIHMEIREDVTSDKAELISDEDLEDITSKKEEKTLYNDILAEERTISDYDDDENYQYKKNVDNNALMGFSFNYPDLKKGCVLMPFKPKRTLTGDLIINTLNAVLQSNEQIDSREATICTIVVTPTTGPGHLCSMQPFGGKQVM